MAWAQYKVSGQIKAEFQGPLMDANVLVLETGDGATSDRNGYYLFTLPAGTYTIRVSYVGYETQQKTVIVNETQGHQDANFELTYHHVDIPNLVVTATRADGHTPMTYVNISKEALQRADVGQDMPYLLQWTPSVVVTSDAGTGVGYTGIRIRGSDPSRINVTINGVPLNDAESQAVYWVNTPDIAGSTQDVQIQRGVGASTNGAGAFGASINLSTATQHEKAYASLQTSAGSFNTFKRSIQLGTGPLKKGFAFDARLSRVTSDGYIDRASASLNSYFLSGMYATSKSFLRFNMFSGHEVTYQAWYGVTADYISSDQLRTYNPAGTEKEGEPYDNEVDNYRQTHYQLLYNTVLNPYWTANLTLHYTRGAGYYEQYKADEYLTDYGLTPLNSGGNIIDVTDLIRRRWLDNHFYGLIYALRYESPSKNTEITIGGGLNEYDGRHFGEVIWARYAAESELGHRYYDNEALKRDANLFVKATFRINPFLLYYIDLQGRFVRYDFGGVNAQGQPVSQQVNLPFFNPKTGLQYVWSTNEAYVSFAVAHREPNRNDYTENTSANRPRPEKLYNTELGFKRRWKNAQFDINAFHMYYIDQLALNGQLNDVGEYRRINIDRSYRAGIEAVGGVYFRPRLHAQANAAISHNKIKAFTEYIDNYDADGQWLNQQPVERRNVDLAFSPSLIGAFELRYDWLKKAGQLGDIALLGKYVGKQYLDNSNDEKTALQAYYYFDLRLQYVVSHDRSGSEVKFTFMAQNLLNKLYETNGWVYRYQFNNNSLIDKGLYPHAGINFWAGITVNL